MRRLYINQSFQFLMEGKYISLITYTKKGDPIATPVWFVEKDDKLYVLTTQKRYKYRRIDNNPKVKVAQCNYQGKVKGSYVEGEARTFTGDEVLPIKKMFKKKYFSSRFMFRNVEGKEKTYGIEITIL